MLSRRLQTLLNVRGRAAFLRSNFAGTHVQPNLQSQYGASRNQSFFTRKLQIPVHTTQEWLASAQKQCATITRCVHSSADDDVSVRQVTENGYARMILVNSKKAPKTIGSPLETIETVSDEDVEKILSRNWKGLSPDEIVKAFKSLSCHAKHNALSFNQIKHGKILDVLSYKLQELNDDQLRWVFQCLVLWEKIKSEICPDHVRLLKELDTACVNRLPRWSLEEKLQFADYLYQVGLSRKSRYIYWMMRNVGTKPRKLNATDFLHFMFLVNVCRKPAINMYEVEYYFDSILEEYTVNELGIIAMAFFKTKSLFRDHNIVIKMHQKVLDEFEETGDITLSAIMKITRYNSTLHVLHTLRKILDRTKSRISKTSMQCLVQASHAAARIQCYDAEFMQMVIERFERDIDSTRIKDLERLCWALSIFDYGSETPLYHQIVENLRDPKRKEEIMRFPAVVPMTLMHLSHAGVFPVDLIQECLSNDFLNRMYNNNLFKIEFEFFVLENNVRVEIPEYDGPFLKDTVRNFLTKQFITSVEWSKKKSYFADQLALEVAHMCKLALKSETAVHIDHLLPQFMKADIVVCLDEANNPVAPEPIFSKMPISSIKYAPVEPSNLRWFAVVLATQNQMLTGTDKHIGLMSSKIRQLKKIGYTPIVIPFDKWFSLKTLPAKQEYMSNLFYLASDRNVSAGAL